jgi:Ca2+-binding EF-hand superfamily protein
LLTARNSQLVFELFKLLDVRTQAGLDDVQFHAFLSCSTDLSDKQIEKVFDIFDLDRSGLVEYEEVGV